MIEENEAQESVTGGLGPDGGSEFKWEDTVVPSDDFSDDVSDAGVGTEAKERNGIASSYFVFALLGLLVSVTSGFAYFHFVYPSRNIETIEPVPNVAASNVAAAVTGPLELGSSSTQMAPAPMSNNTISSPSTVYEHTDDSTYTDGERHSDGDTVLPLTSVDKPKDVALEDQAQLHSSGITDIVLPPISVLSDNAYQALQGTISGQNGQPILDISGSAPSVEPYSAMGKADVKDNLRQDESRGAVPHRADGEEKSVNSDMAGVKLAPDQKDLLEVSTVAGQDVNSANRVKQVSVSEKPQKAISSSGNTKQGTQPDNGLKKVRETRVSNDTMVAKNSAKTDTQRKVSYVLRSASAKSAWIEDVLSPGLLREVTIGDTIPEFGKVEGIVREGDRWVVVGKKAILR